MSKPYFHPQALVESMHIGDDTRIWAFTHVMTGAIIGSNCNIGEHSFIESGAVIGDHVTIKNGNMIWEGITLEEGVFIGPGVIFTNDLFPRSPRMLFARERYRSNEWLAETLVKQGATIGAGAVILPGKVIHEYAMVGAGSVVTRDVPPHALVVGNPSRPTGWVCKCGRKLDVLGGEAECTCGLIYLLTKNTLKCEKDMVAV